MGTTTARTWERAGEDARWGRWNLAWHGFFYLLLVYATVAAVSDGGGGAAGVAVRLLPAAALGAWYWLWLLGPGRRASRATRAYLVGALVLWVALILLDPEFLLLGIAIFAQVCLYHIGWALAVTLVVLGGTVWQAVTGPGRVSWPALATSLLVMAGALLAVGTVGAIVRQSDERLRLVEQLRATRAELAAAEREAGTLEERQRLARDIHDTLAQGFASVVMLLEAAEESLAHQHPATAHVRRALRSARDNLAESRRVVWALRPRSLAERSLPAALEELAGTLGEESGLRAGTVVTGTPRPLAAEAETALLRVAQEALANVRRHAGAGAATVTISYLDDVVMLDVQDDGAGFDPAGATGGLGLRAMRERVESLGGSLVVESAPGEGTTVAAQVPAGRQPATVSDGDAP